MGCLVDPTGEETKCRLQYCNSLEKLVLIAPPGMDREVNVLDGAGESFILLGIVVLESDLQFNALGKLALFGLKKKLL